MRNENEGVLKMNMDCEVEQKLLTDEMMKTNQHTMDGVYHE